MARNADSIGTRTCRPVHSQGLCVSNSQFSRRYTEAMQAFLWLLRRRLRPVPPGAGLSLVLDRTGLSLAR